MAVPFRKHLDHTQHFAGRFGAIYFVTICSLPRGFNHDESLAEKFAYIRQNPARAGLVGNENAWPYVFIGDR